MTQDSHASARRQWQAKVTGIPGVFAAFTGGDVNAPSTNVWDGGADFPDPISGSPEAGNLTVTRPFHLTRDNPLLQEMRERVGEFRTTVSKQPTTSNGIPRGNPTTYPEALLIGVVEPDYEAAASNANVWGMIFAPGQYR